MIKYIGIFISGCVNVFMLHIITKFDKLSFSSFSKVHFTLNTYHVGCGGLLHIVKTERGIFLQLFQSCLVVKLLQIYNSRLIGRNDGSNTTNPQTYISWRFACMFKKDSHAKLSQTYAQTILYHFKILNWQITCQLNICLLVFLFVTYLCRYSHRSLSF